MDKNIRSLSLSIALALSVTGCGDKAVRVTSLPALPTPTINVPAATPPTVNVAAPQVTVTPTITAAVQLPTGTFLCPSTGTPGDCDGDGVRDDADHCLNVPQGTNGDPTRPGCPLIVIDAGLDANSADAASPITSLDANSADAGSDADNDAGADAGADAGSAPEAAVVVQTPPPVVVVQPPAVVVQQPPVTELPGNTVGTAIQARVSLPAARVFCTLTVEQVRTGQHAAPDAPCAAGEIGCWRRATSSRVPSCSSSHDSPGCINPNGTAWGCSGDAQRPNAWVYRCGPRVTGNCTPEALEAAAGVAPVS